MGVCYRHNEGVAVAFLGVEAWNPDLVEDNAGFGINKNNFVDVDSFDEAHCS